MRSLQFSRSSFTLFRPSLLTSASDGIGGEICNSKFTPDGRETCIGSIIAVNFFARRRANSRLLGPGNFRPNNGPSTLSSLYSSMARHRVWPRSRHWKIFLVPARVGGITTKPYALRFFVTRSSKSFLRCTSTGACGSRLFATRTGVISSQLPVCINSTMIGRFEFLAEIKCSIPLIFNLCFTRRSTISDSAQTRPMLCHILDSSPSSSCSE